MPLYFGGSGVTPTLKTGTNRISLAPGQTWLIQPAGWYYVKAGGYTAVQQFDPVLGIWVPIGGGSPGSAAAEYFYADGVNYRLANQTGCAVGSVLTNVGSGYTSAPTVTASAGSSIWRAVLGTYVTSVTVSAAGSNYTYPPTVIFSAPPAGGIPATGYATLSGGTVSAVTMINQGGGYTTPPTINFVNDPREGVNNVTQGYGASAIAVMAGAGAIAGVVCVDPGVGGLTAVPTLAFSGGGGASAAATALMCWSITAFTPTAGTGFTGPSLLSGLDAISQSGVAAPANPIISTGLVRTRLASIKMVASAGAPTATGSVIYDGGIYTSTPTALITTNGALITQTTTIAFTMGGQNDTSFISS